MESVGRATYIHVMGAIPFDTLKLARTLRDKAHFTAEQAEGVADALADAFQDRVATKDYLALLEQRLTIKIGGMLAVAVGVLTAFLKLAS
ncbi:hypothetical protein [Ancylobacter sp. SL191]|uniref:hypothetical protein n=1 Tax=Ancylobacter sp. SL191 TaxID=2995166 RepID=UPI00226E284B|nr:hypothetical protein [Ancylobacter sp. SL191]WAC25976.1 hypothetical protein OU996_13210 [Ancylobacter sp. SL191]